MSRQTAGQRWCSLVLLAVFLSLFLYYGLPAIAFRIGRSMEAGRRDAAGETVDALVDELPPDQRWATFVRASRSVRPAVVQISAVHVLDAPESGVAEGDTDTGHPVQISRGCGVVIDPRGLVLTSRRVVHGARRTAVALVHDPHPIPADVIGSDATTDLAVLRFRPPAEGVSAVELSGEHNLALGETVVAIGNAYHPGEFLWAGAVTDCGSRPSAACCDWRDCIQTAAVNPWNCGAPLVNLQGTVVGISTSFRGSQSGLRGLAVPADTARQVAAQLCGQGWVTRGWLGVFIRVLQPTPAVRRSVELPEGALAVAIDYVVPGSPAESGGLRAGDLILKFAGSSFSSAEELRKQVAGTAPGAAAVVAVWRDEEAVDRSVAIGLQPVVGPQLPGEKEWGLRLVSHLLSQEPEMDVGEIPNAVVVQAVDARSRARGLTPRDVILSVDGVRTPTLEIFCREASQICRRQTRAVQLEVSTHGSVPRTVKLGDD